MQLQPPPTSASLVAHRAFPLLSSNKVEQCVPTENSVEGVAPEEMSEDTREGRIEDVAATDTGMETVRNIKLDT